MARSDLIERLCSVVGNPPVRLIDAENGWPGLVELQTANGPVKLAIHIGPVGRLYPDRREDDYRVQPPGAGRPVQDRVDAITLALGWWEVTPPVIVACNPDNWRDASKRTSQMFKLSMLQSAQATGWASYTNDEGDTFFAFRPFLLSAYVQAVVQGINPATVPIPATIGSNWTNTTDSATTQERTRVECTRIVRDAAFRRDVVAAYSGRCAMCGLNFGLVVAAHIHPVAASGSVDEVVNGLCLCPNHHQAFDSHRIWVHPDTKEIKVHPDLKSGASAGDKAITSTLFPALQLPADSKYHPSPERFRQRYALPDFVGKYAWV